MRFVSHAQNFEDVLLYRALRHVERGFYVDIGAQDPVVDSVSLAFYERGWRGVHVEPSPRFASMLRQHRPDEEIFQCAVGAARGAIRFFSIPDTGLSTAEERIAAQHRTSGFETHEITVECRTLSELLAPYQGRDIHWMKIDTEGMEREVIEGWDRRALRPWIVVIEATEPLSEVRSHSQWEPMLLENDYRFAFFDGLNRYFVAVERSYLLEKFDRPANVFDDFVLSGLASNSFSALLNERIGEIQGRLQQAQSDLATARQDLSTSEAGVRRMVEQTASQQGEIERLNGLVADQREEALRLNDHIRSSTAQIERLNRHVDWQKQGWDAAIAEAERLKRHIDWQKQGWDAANADAIARAIEIEGVRRSLSWRLTAPFRKANSVRRTLTSPLHRLFASLKRVRNARAEERPIHLALWLRRRPRILALVRRVTSPLPVWRASLDRYLEIAGRSGPQLIPARRDGGFRSSPDSRLTPRAREILDRLERARERNLGKA
jgi:FkbM family methyltransferase